MMGLLLESGDWWHIIQFDLFYFYSVKKKMKISTWKDAPIWKVKIGVILFLIFKFVLGINKKQNFHS